MFTLKQIQLWLEKLTKENKKIRIKLIDHFSDQEKEMAISKCSIKDQDNNFDANLFHEIQDEEFFNPYINWIGECFIDSLNKGKDKFLINQKIKNHLTDLKRLGVEGSHGFAFSSKFKSKKKIDNIFVIKSGVSEDLRFDEIRHEVLVGFELNKLRSKIPNFAYVYGGFNCGLPMIINKKAENWCSTNGNITYIVYEYIKNEMRFRDYLTTCSTLQFIEKYLQLLLASNLAHQEMDYTHFDLHNDNVLMRELDTKFIAIKYTFPNNRTRYLLTDKIMTIIDYGFAHIKKLGNPLFLAYGIYPNTSNIFNDAFKFFCFCMHILKYDNYPVYRSLFPIMKFFDSEDSVDNIINRGIADLYVCPKVTEDGLDSLIKFILENYKCNTFIVDRIPSKYKLVNCQECYSLNEVRNMFSEHPYQDVMEQIYNNGKDNIDYSTFSSAKRSKELEIERQEAKINKLLTSIDGERLDVNSLFSVTYMRRYKKYLSNLAKLIDLRDNLKYNVILLDKASSLFGEKPNINLDKNLFSRINNNYRFMLLDSEKIERKRDQATTKTMLVKRPIFNWWFDEERSAFA